MAKNGLAKIGLAKVGLNPHRVGVVIASLQEQLFRHARIRLHGGKTQVWNGAGIRPLACDVLEQIARGEDPPCCGLEGVRIASGVPGHQGVGNTPRSR